MSESGSDTTGEWRSAFADKLGVDVDDIEDVTAEVRVTDIGGIEECTVPVSPETTLLPAENASGKSSFLRALNAVLGGSEATVREQQESGSVELRFTHDGDSVAVFDRTVQSASGGRSGAQFSGDAFCSDGELVDTFVTLLKNNAARQAVEQGDDLREVLMRPVDTAELKRKINSKREERDELDDELEMIETRLRDKPGLERELEQLQAERDDIEAEIEEVKSTIDEFEAGEEMASEAEALVDELEATRDQHRKLQRKLQIHRNEREALDDEEQRLRSELDDLGFESGAGVDGESDVDVDLDASSVSESIDRLGDEIDRLERRRDELNDLISNVRSIISVNEDAFESAVESSVVAAGRSGDEGSGSRSAADVTAALNPSAQSGMVECWTCGTEVQESVIEERVGELREFVQEKRGTVDDLEDEIESKRHVKDVLESKKSERQEIEERLSEIERDKTVFEEKIQGFEADIEDVQEEIEELEVEVEETAELRDSGLPDAYERLGDLQAERGRVEEKIENKKDELDEIEQLRDSEQVQEERDAVNDELTGLRDRVKTLEKEAVEQFNHHMASIVDRLDFDNISRVWIERTSIDESGSFDTGEFDLQVARVAGHDAVFEGSIETLSESERAVVGLVVALAGYLVHDVAAECPFLLLDSVEDIDAERLRALIEYFEQHTAFLTVALLPEDAAAFPGETPRVAADALRTTASVSSESE